MLVRAKLIFGIEGWIEGLSILVSVLVVINVQAGTDYSKAKEFRRQVRGSDPLRAVLICCSNSS